MSASLATDSRPSPAHTGIPAWFVGETLGTFLLVFFGCGSVAASVLLGASVGVFQVAIVWGLGIAMAIHLTGSLSGAHLNPAVTLGLAAAGRGAWRDVPKYTAAQLLGAFAASAVLYAIYRGPLLAYEAAHGLVRGAPGSEATAMIFGEFFPNPGGLPLSETLRQRVTPLTAWGIEAVGTGVLLLVILACTDERNRSRPQALTPVAVGLTVTLLISLLGPLTMAGLNPARDFAPRVFSALAGWGRLPFTANGLGWLSVYITAPLVGALIAGFGYRYWLGPLYGKSA